MCYRWTFYLARTWCVRRTKIDLRQRFCPKKFDFHKTKRAQIRDHYRRIIPGARPGDWIIQLDDVFEEFIRHVRNGRGDRTRGRARFAEERVTRASHAWMTHDANS